MKEQSHGQKLQAKVRSNFKKMLAERDSGPLLSLAYSTDP